ncbi:hypothetical protein [Candidatus Uabimicrobium sp. HlEnr_7]|uniref:hypothetical protein n=1 Tax=Candidatus Uabimicrobium helgolandensis TaxID=3095367 RepID=UPI0035593310
MKDTIIFFFALVIILNGCSSSEETSESTVDLSYNSSINSTSNYSSQNTSLSTPTKPTKKRKKKNTRRTRKNKKRTKSVVGNWEAADKNFHMSFQKGGRGTATRDKDFNGHLYTYYRDFLWKQKSAKILVKYTSETTIRDGINIVREKTLSEKVTFRMSGNQLNRKGGNLYRKQ